jgi:hypothetical protein
MIRTEKKPKSQFFSEQVRKRIPVGDISASQFK